VYSSGSVRDVPVSDLHPCHSYCFISEEVTDGREVGLPADNAMLLESRPALGNSETCYSDFGLTVRFLLRLYVASERG
jgi:hypothetical protein